MGTTMKKLGTFLLGLLLLIGTVLAIMYMAVSLLDRDEYHKSYSTKECVCIKRADGTVLPCSEYDETKSYIFVWVP